MILAKILVFITENLSCVHRRGTGFASGQHVGFVVDEAALGQVFSEYFGFPSQSFHQFLHKSPGACVIGLLVAAVPSGPNYNPPPPHYTN
jgi:hypothetical protein